MPNNNNSNGYTTTNNARYFVDGEEFEVGSDFFNYDQQIMAVVDEAVVDESSPVTPDSLRQAMNRVIRPAPTPAPVVEFTMTGRSVDAYENWTRYANEAWSQPARPARSSPRPVAPAPTPVNYDHLWPEVERQALAPLRNYYGSRAQIVCRIPNMPVWGHSNVVYQITLEGETEPFFAAFKVTYRGTRVYEVQLTNDPQTETNYIYQMRRNCGQQAIRQYHEAVRAARYKLIAKQYALNAKVFQQFLPTMLDDLELRLAMAPKAYQRANKQAVVRERAALREQAKIEQHLSTPRNAARMPETDRGDRARSSRTRIRNNRRDSDEN